MPTIALVDGYALGGGAELAYACDFRHRHPDGEDRQPRDRASASSPPPVPPGGWPSWSGEPVAKEILLAGRILDAEEAHALRLLNEVVEPDDLEAAGHRWADRIARQGPLAVRLTKTVFHAPREAHPVIDDLAQAVLFETEDKERRMTAFLERNKEKR